METANAEPVSDRAPRTDRAECGVDRFLRLQQAIGNRATQSLLAGGLLQPKLRIGPVDDVYEREADRTADRVMRMPDPASDAAQPLQAPISRVQRMCPECEEQPIQRMCAECEEEEEEKVRRQVQDEDEEVVEKQEDEELLQRKATESGAPPVDAGTESHITSLRGGGQPLPPATRSFFEPRFGHDFSGVRLHTGATASGVASAINARAFTIGRDIMFGAGEYAPNSNRGRHLLGHELTHVLQQSSTATRKSPLNQPAQAAAPAGLDREADVMGAEALQMQPLEKSAFEMHVHTTQSGLHHIQRKPKKKKKKKKSTYVPYQVHVKKPMTVEEFRVAAMRQIFGRELLNVVWRNSKDSYVPANSPYTVRVDTRLLKRQRGLASEERGISVEEGGGVTGAKERAKAFHAGPGSGEKSSLMKEIDRRYFEAVGDKTETKIKAGEKGKAALWHMIRDEVLFQHEYIANLPSKVKELIKFSIKGKKLTPADYDKLFAIAKKIQKMPAGQVSDYASKVTGATTDLDAFEASLDKYLAEMAERGQQAEERDKIKTKLIGLEEVYKKYRRYKSLVTSASISGEAGLVVALEAVKMRKELDTQLQAHGFAGVADFEAFIKKYEKAFEQEAANIAMDVLDKYAGKLYRESERYKDPAEVAALHQKLGGVRTQYAEFEKNAKISNEYAKSARRGHGRLPGEGHMRPKITAREAAAARNKAEAAKASAASQVKGMSSEHTIFQEEGLPLDKRIDKKALAKASESQLGGLLQGHIGRRMTAIGEAKAEIKGKPELIYKMDKLFPLFYVQQGIRPGSIHDLIIQDKMKSDAILKLVKGIALAIVAIAIAVITFGTATPALIAAGAGIAGAGLGVYMAFEEYQQYAQEKNLADVGFANDPSVVWLVIAIAGAALDMAAAVKAVSALGKAAKALDAGGDLKAFTNLVRQLEKEKKITAEIARAADNAAAARKGFAEASSELSKAMSGKLYSFPGPLADPDVYKAVVKMARQAIKTKVYDATKFIEELKLARVRAGFGDLTPEELAKAKQAWDEAKKLVKVEAASVTKYGDSMSKLLARTDLPGDLQNDIIAQVGRAMNNASVDDNAVRAAISSMRRAENPHNVREFLAELRHVNEVASAKSLAKGSKVYSGVKKSMPDGSLRQFDLGNGIKVDISPVSEADALYRAGGKIHLDEVKHTASALVNKLREKPQQLQNLVDWRKAAPDRTVSIVIESEVKWTNLLGTPDVFKVAIKNKIPLKIGGKVFDPAALKAFHAKIEAKYIDLVVNGGMSPRAFMELPEMATLDSAMKFVGYP